jgi:hypothetical protein
MLLIMPFVLPPATSFLRSKYSLQYPVLKQRHANCNSTDKQATPQRLSYWFVSVSPSVQTEVGTQRLSCP